MSAQDDPPSSGAASYLQIERAAASKVEGVSQQKSSEGNFGIRHEGEVSESGPRTGSGHWFDEDGDADIWQDILDDYNLFKPIDHPSSSSVSTTPKSLSPQKIIDNYKKLLEQESSGGASGRRQDASTGAAGLRQNDSWEIAEPGQKFNESTLRAKPKASGKLKKQSVLAPIVGAGSIHCFGIILFRTGEPLPLSTDSTNSLSCCEWECLVVRYWNGYDGFPKGVRRKGMTARQTAVNETALSVGLQDHQYQLLGPMVIEETKVQIRDAVGYFVGIMRPHSVDAKLKWNSSELESARWRPYTDTLVLKSITIPRLAALARAHKLAKNLISP